MGSALIRKSIHTFMGRRNRMGIKIGMALLLSSLIFLHSLITAPILLHNGGTVITAGNTEIEVLTYTLLHPYGEPALLSEVGEADRHQKLRIRAADYGIRDVRRLINRILYLVSLSVTGLWVFGNIRLSIMTRKERCGSLLALSIGGHAPPV